MKRLFVLALLLLASTSSGSVDAQTSGISVTIDGAPVAFDEPPLERVGRVYVPLRGIFERLGASVVYENGRIAATRGSTTVSLQVGSALAFEDGRPVTLDAPPFLEGARTLVPLRFIAQAVGATVTYTDETRTVAITQATARFAPQPAPAQVVRVEPAPDSTISESRPEISASFDRPVDPNTVRLSIDGRDVSANSYISPRAVSYEPTFDLPYGIHSVALRGVRVQFAWSFANAAPPQPDFLDRLSPPNGARVGSQFVVRGFTQPYAGVQVVAVADDRLAFGVVNRSSVTRTSAADGKGYFAVPIAILDFASSVVDVRVESRAPGGGVAVRTLRLRP